MTGAPELDCRLKVAGILLEDLRKFLTAQPDMVCTAEVLQRLSMTANATTGEYQEAVIISDPKISREIHAAIARWRRRENGR